MLKEILFLDIYYPLSFLFLILSFLSYFLKEEKRINYLGFLLVSLILTFLFYSFLLSLLQYFLWKNNNFSKFLLPPYTPFSYFLNYVFFNFFRDLIFRLLGFLLVFNFLYLIFFTLKRDPFYDDEKYFILLSSLLFSFPYNFFFIFISFFILLLMATLSILFKKRKEYYSFRFFWLPLSLLILILEIPLYKKFFFLIQMKP
jgi:hypothetical protein